jgi:hypothetical protein
MPEKGGMDLIYTLWQTETNHFKSASQNYSQLVLAAMLEMNSRISPVKNKPEAFLSTLLPSNNN